METRTFTKRSFLRISYLVGAIAMAYPVISFITFRRPTERTIVLHPDEYKLPVNFKQGVYLVRQMGQEYALSAQCTHLGCTVNYDTISQQFRCPCHGSIFDLAGKRVAGPAKKALMRPPLTKKPDGRIIVTLPL